jgi:rod shape-determining protein MreB
VVSISTTEILEAFGELSERIIETIHRVLESTPPELVADVSQNGIVLTGGGSQLWGFDKFIESRTNIPTRLADDAELCVAYGIGKSLAQVSDMHEGTINLSRRKQLKN